LYSSVNIDAAATIACTQFSAFSCVLLLTNILTEVVKNGCHAASHIIFCASVSAWLNILYASHSLAQGALFDQATMLSGPDTIATIGFHSQLKIQKIGFLVFLYFHFATKLAAFLAFLLKEKSGFITI
jgi:hypothetical protein